MSGGSGKTSKKLIGTSIDIHNAGNQENALCPGGGGHLNAVN